MPDILSTIYELIQSNFLVKSMPNEVKWKNMENNNMYSRKTSFSFLHPEHLLI